MNTDYMGILEQLPFILSKATGIEVTTADISELSGGTHNQVYLIEPEHGEKVVIRIAPAEDENTYWEDRSLMRREYGVQHYFAAVSSLMPNILAIDFTQQIITRDYMIQAYIEGERWEDVEDELDDEDNLILWQQFGTIQREIHDTVGDQFGWPYPGKAFATWSELIINRFGKIMGDMSSYSLDISALSNVLTLIQNDKTILDVVTQPKLLHGDLWLFNLLINRERLEIVGLLDADRAWWGDPLADWAIFLFTIRDDEEEWMAARAAFEKGYGPLVEDHGAAHRVEIYKIMHLGSLSIWAMQNEYMDQVERACKKQAELAERLLN